LIRNKYAYVFLAPDVRKITFVESNSNYIALNDDQIYTSFKKIAIAKAYLLEEK
jgi:hypothetical protein